MYRIKLTSGEETVYRSIDELSLGIRSGVIGPEALIHHQKSNQWLPIALHPDYKQALSQEPPALTAADAEAQRAAEAESAVIRSLTRRRTVPTPVLVGLGVILTTVLAFFLWRLRGDLFPVASANPPPAISQPVADPPAGTGGAPAAAPSPGPAPTLAPSGPVAEPPQQAPPAVPPATPPPAPPTPESMAQRYAAAYDAAIAEMDDELGRLRLSQLFTVTRLGSGDSVRATSRALAGAMNIVRLYRGQTAKVEQAYQDTVQAQVAGHTWTPEQLAAWKKHGSKQETFEAARLADSLLTAMEGVFALLAAQEGQSEVAAGSLSFNDSASAAKYEELSGWLNDRVAALTSSLTTPIVARILRTIGSTRLPDLIEKAPTAPAIGRDST